MSKGGRPLGNIFNNLKFQLVKDNRSYSAHCKICCKILKNTSQNRLRAHRNICHDRDSDGMVSNQIEYVELDETLEDASLPAIDDNSSFDGEVTPIVMNSDMDEAFSLSNTSTSTPKRRKCDNNVLTKFIDKLKDGDLQTLNEKLTKFIVACNVPFHVVESVFFKDFIKALRPAYHPKIPCRKTLSTSLLDNIYEKCLHKTKDIMSSNSVLLIDGWKNSSNNSKLVVTMLHNADGTQAFLEAFDLTGESETSEKLCEIVNEAITIAKTNYNTNIYAMVSDNASNMVRLGTLLQHKIWHSTCSSHTANLLAKDILDKELTENVSIVLKEFKQADFEKMLVDKGGSRIRLPCETRWCSYRDSYRCFLNNLTYMKLIAVETKKKLKSNVSRLLFNEEFVSQVEECLLYFDPVCKLINACQSSNTSMADAVSMWLQLDIPRFKDALEKRRGMAMHVMALTAYYLHPGYDNAILDKDNRKSINHFLLKHLDAQGLEEFDSFVIKSAIFSELFRKNISKPLVFWRLASHDCPNLSELALKLLNIPASSAQLERLFSTWGFVHNCNRNRLSFERSKKLSYLYYSYRLNQLEDGTDSDEDCENQ